MLVKGAIARPPSSFSDLRNPTHCQERWRHKACDGLSSAGIVATAAFKIDAAVLTEFSSDDTDTGYCPFCL